MQDNNPEMTRPVEVLCSSALLKQHFYRKTFERTKMIKQNYQPLSELKTLYRAAERQQYSDKKKCEYQAKKLNNKSKATK